MDNDLSRSRWTFWVGIVTLIPSCILPLLAIPLCPNPGLIIGIALMQSSISFALTTATASFAPRLPEHRDGGAVSIPTQDDQFKEARDALAGCFLLSISSTIKSIALTELSTPESTSEMAITPTPRWVTRGGTTMDEDAPQPYRYHHAGCMGISFLFCIGGLACTALLAGQCWAIPGVQLVTVAAVSVVICFVLLLGVITIFGLLVVTGNGKR